jgi:hypothetical protein
MCEIICRIIWFSVLLALLSGYIFSAAMASAKSNGINWDSKTRTFSLSDAKIKIGYNMVCGYYDNQAEFSSFGMEQQMFKCSKIIIPIDMSYKRFFGRLTLAPLYDSIKSERPATAVTYGKDAEGREIQGNNPYFDWYKNLGTRAYYLGEYPILQAYFGVEVMPQHSIIAGRIKNQNGLADEDTPWDDDGMFSPYAYWLSRDLLSGVRYQFINDHVSASASILSGNNPMKGYANYLNNVQGPNLKANNTPSLAAKVTWNWGNLFAADNGSRLILAITDSTMSSTWADGLGFNGATNADGKRRNSVYAAALKIDYPLGNKFRLDLFSQYTAYLSGLEVHSSQDNAAIPYFKDITQQGLFAGVGVSHRLFKLHYTFSYFDRFDYNVYQNFVDNKSNFFGQSLSELEDMKQYAHIMNLSLNFTNYFSMGVNYMYIDNPLRWVSSVLDTHSDHRVGVLLELKF